MIVENELLEAKTKCWQCIFNDRTSKQNHNKSKKQKNHSTSQNQPNQPKICNKQSNKRQSISESKYIKLDTNNMYKFQPVKCMFCGGSGSQYRYQYRHNRYQYCLSECTWCSGRGIDASKTMQKKIVYERQQAIKEQTRKGFLQKTEEGRRQLEKQRQQQQQNKQQQKQRSLRAIGRKMARERQQKEELQKSIQEWKRYLLTPQGILYQQKLVRKFKCQQSCRKIIYCCGQNSQWKRLIWILLFCLLIGLGLYLLYFQPFVIS